MHKIKNTVIDQWPKVNVYLIDKAQKTEKEDYLYHFSILWFLLRGP